MSNSCEAVPRQLIRPPLRGSAVVLLTAGLIGAGLGVANPAGASPVPVVTPTSTTQVAPNTTASLAGLDVAGYGAEQSIQVTLATSVGSVAIASHQDLTLSYGNSWSGDSSITFTGTEDDASLALATATLSSGNSAGQTAKVSLTVSPADDSHVYLAPNQHYFEFVPAPAITWTDADTAAKSRTFQGQHGYLATIPTATVNDFVKSKIQGAVNVWFGARGYNDGGGHPRTWRWAKGVDESPLQGQALQYCDDSSYSVLCTSPGSNAGLYNSWAPGEPNNSGQNCQYDDFDDYSYGCTAGEDFAVTNYGEANGLWNDFPNSIGSQSSGYVVEYGDLATGSTGFDGTISASSDVLVVDVPAAPTGVSATAGDGTAAVSFTAPAANGSPITSYAVTSSPGQRTATCPGSPCTVSGLTNGTSYTFSVVATNGVGDSAPSTSSAAVTPIGVPGAPSDVVATRGNGSASITFAPPAGNGGSAITTYTVTSSPGGKTAQCDGLSACVVTGLTNGTAYTFTVTATNSVGTGTASGASNSITPATTPDAPSIISVTSRAGGLTVRFTAPNSDGSDQITGYEYSVDGEHWFALTTTGSGPYTGTVDGLTNGTAYPVRVRAANSVGAGTMSAAVSATPATTPGAPSAVAAKVENRTVTVTWSAPANDGGADITGYTVTAQPGGATCTTQGATSCTFTALAPGKSYRFIVAASNASGEGTATGVGTGAVSHPSRSVVVPGKPTRPRNLRVKAGDRTLTVTYAAPADGGGSRITRYQVSIDGGKHWRSSGRTGTVLRGVLNGATFHVVVRAINAHGAGPATKVVTAKTRQWFHDPIGTKARKAQHAVPSKPSHYRGKRTATRAAARSHNGTPAVAATSLHGRQLQRGQATSLGTDGLFAFDSAKLNAAGKRQVRTIVRSMRYVHGFVCEGYADYGGSSTHQQLLSRQRAKALCSALRAAGAKGRSTTKGYGASRPAVIGGSPSHRAGNRRVVVLVTR